MLSKRLICFARIPTKAFHLSAVQLNADNSVIASKILENKILCPESNANLKKISIILSVKNLHRNYDTKESTKTKNFSNFEPDDIELQKRLEKLQKSLEDCYERRKKVERITKIAQGWAIFFFTIFLLDWIFDT